MTGKAKNQRNAISLAKIGSSSLRRLRRWAYLIGRRVAAGALAFILAWSMIVTPFFSVLAPASAEDLPTVTTHNSVTGEPQSDFSPEETVLIRGVALPANTEIDVKVTRPDGSMVTGNGTWTPGYDTVTTDASGNFSYNYILDGIEGTYIVNCVEKATGESLATTTFTDSKYHLQGFTREGNHWTNGVLKGWLETEWVPYRLEITATTAFTDIFGVQHDYQWNGSGGPDPGVDQCNGQAGSTPTDFYIGDENGIPISGAAWTPIGSEFVYDSNTTIIQYNGTLTVTVAGHYYLYWFAHLATGSSQWSGASLHAHKTGANQDVPIQVPGAAPNTPPVANNQSVVTDEDTAVNIALSASDADGDPLTYAVVSVPSHGALSGEAPNLTYTPTANYNGPDSFTYKANDGLADSNTATVSITVNPVNDAPVAYDQSVATPEETAVAITLAASDIDGDFLTYTVVTPPTHGTVTGGTGADRNYLPDLNYNGPDSFTFKVNDGHADSNIATVSITVNPVNDAPVAVDDSYSTDEDTALTITAPGVLGNDTDTEGNPLTAVKVSDPSHGSLTLNADGSFTYTPTADYNGPDSFTYKADDGTDYSNIATVSITVNPVNDAPVAVDDSYSTDEDTALTIAAPGVLTNDTDTEGNPLTAVKVSDPSHGSLTLNADGSFTYTPTANYNGPDSFTYKANDGLADSNTATVSITVNPVNDAPVADAGGPYSGSEGSPISLDGGSSTDPDSGDILAFAWDLDNNGTYETSDQVVSKTWFDNASYPVGLRVTDSGGLTSTNTTTVNVANVAPDASATNDGPKQVNAVVIVTASQTDPGTLDTFAYSFDWEDDGTYEVVDQSAAQAIKTWSEAGNHTVRVRVRDDDGGIGTSTTTVSIYKGAEAGALSGYEGSPITFDGSASSMPGTINLYEWDFDTSVNTNGTSDPADDIDAIGPIVMHTYYDNGTYTAELTVHDNLGNVSSSTTSVVVYNVDPDASATNNGPINEGLSATVTASQTDPGTLDTFTYSFDWNGDGDYADAGEIVDQALPSASNNWNDNGTYTVGVKVKDDDGGEDTATTDVVVNDLSPTAILTGDTALAESELGDFDASGSTSSPDAIALYQWDWNYTGTFLPSGDTGPTQAHSWSTPGTRTVAVRVTDDDGSTAIATLGVTVGNDNPPTVSITQPVSGETINIESFMFYASDFADSVVDYSPGTPLDGAILDFDNPQTALGPAQGVTNQDSCVSLGPAGSLTVELVNNLLNDGPGEDIYIFEVGPDIEATDVEVSEDGVTWTYVGTVAGSTATLDISSYVSPDQVFRYIRVTDVLGESTETGPWAGADIDAIGAISSTLVVNGLVNVSADATDDFGVEKVDIYIDDVLEASISSPPYEYLWSAYFETNGFHQIKTIAYDTIGQTDQEVMDVFVNNYDFAAPNTYGLEVSPNPTGGVQTVTVSAIVDDTANEGSNIFQAECFIQGPGPEGTGIPMNALDGAFDSPVEVAIATVDISTLPVADYDVYVRGRDAGGNWGLLSSTSVTITSASNQKVIRIESNAIQFAGTWTDFNYSPYSSGSTKYSNVASSYCTFSFKGATAIKWVGYKGPARGKAEVFIDNVSFGIWDQYSPTGGYQQTIFDSTSIAALDPNTTHTMKVVVTGTKNPSATNTIIEMDCFDLVTPLRIESNAIQFSGTWAEFNYAPYSEGSTKYTNTASAYCTFSFKGATAIRWLGYKGPSRGIAEVFIDNVSYGTWDQYSSSGSYHSLMFNSAGIVALDPNTSHTIKVVSTGTKRPEATATTIDVDCFEAVVTVTDVTGPTTPASLTATASASMAQINLSWGASTDGTGVGGYRIERSPNGSSSWVHIGTTLATSHADSQGLNPSTQYYYRVKAYDSYGNPSGYSGVQSATTCASTRFEQTGASFAWSGAGWHDLTSSMYSGGNTKYSTGTGNTATFSFVGTGVGWIATKTVSRGIAKVYIDGVYQQNVDLYNLTAQPRLVVYSKTGLSPGAHTITIEVTGTRNPSATSVSVEVDACDVW